MNKFFLLLLCSVALCLSVGCPKEEDEVIPPPDLTNPLATPASVVQGNSVRFTVQVSSSKSTIQAVTIDLTVFGGSATQSMYDDGTFGDISSGDGMYSYSFLMPVTATVGAQSLPIAASDTHGNSSSTTLAVTVVQNQAPAISNGTISRDPVAPGSRFTVTVDASDSDGTLSSVEADLTPLGLVSNATLYDDGTNGDSSAGDGTYSFESLASPAASAVTGASIVFTAEDNALASSTTNVTFDVSTNVAPAMTNESVSPAIQVQRLDVTFSVDVTDTDGLTSVVCDLSPIDGLPSQAMTNTGGDTYEFTYTLPFDCSPGTWAIVMTATDTLSETNFTYVYVAVSANNPPSFLLPQATPDPCSRNRDVLLSVYVSDADGTVASVEVDLSAINGSATQAMYDDGTNGDAASGDGTYSYEYFIPATGFTVGLHSLQVTATDDDTVSDTTNISLQTLTNRAPTISSPLATPSTQEVDFSANFSVTATDLDGGITVEIDLSSIGGLSNQAMVNTSGDTWEYTYLLPTTGITAGAKTLPVTVDDGTETASTNISFTVQANQNPSLTNAGASPDITLPDRIITVTVDASDNHGLASVTADLSNFGRSMTEPMVDDGGHGDGGSGDGTYGCYFTAAALSSPGQQSITITATDTLTATANTSVNVRIARYHLEHAAFLEDIHGSSSSNIFAVGEASQVYHWDGTDWRLTDAYPGQNVNWWSVWADSTTDVWIGGAGGQVRQFDGKDWTDNSPSGAGGYEIRGIWSDGTSNKVVVVGGENGTSNNGGWANTWDGSSWGSTPQTDGDDFNDVFGAGSSDIMIVGDNGEHYHWDGASWSAPNHFTSEDITGVWGYANTNNSTTYYWVVTFDASRFTEHAEIWYTSFPTGTPPGTGSWTWTQVGSLPRSDIDLGGIHGSVSSGALQVIYVTGSYFMGQTPVQNNGTVWSSTNGTSFSWVTTGNNYFPNAAYRLILTDAFVPPGGTDCWIAGHRSIQYYNSSSSPTWTEYSRGTYEDTRAVSTFSATRGLTCDFPVRPGSTGGRQISCIMHDYGSGTWTEYTEYTYSVGTTMDTYAMLYEPPNQSGTPVCPRMYALKMFSASAVYGVGDDGHVMFWDGQNTVTHDFSSQNQFGSSSSDQRRLYAIWGTGASDFWFGGEDGYMYHYQGTTWSIGSQVFSANETVTGIWGTSNTNIYAVTAERGVGSRSGTEGNIYHNDGTGWTSIAGTDDLPIAGSGNLNAIWGTGAGDIYVAGDGGVFVHWDGSNWNDASGNLSGVGTTDIMAVFGDGSLPTPETYVVGVNMRVWLKRGLNWYNLRGCSGGKDLLGGDSSSTLILVAGQDGITLRLEK